MIIKIGPIVIMDSKTRAAYKTMFNKAYALHQTINYADDLTKAGPQIRALDAELSEAISYVPASEVDPS